MHTCFRFTQLLVVTCIFQHVTWIRHTLWQHTAENANQTSIIRFGKAIYIPCSIFGINIQLDAWGIDAAGPKINLIYLIWLGPCEQDSKYHVHTPMYNMNILSSSPLHDPCCVRCHRRSSTGGLIWSPTHYPESQTHYTTAIEFLGYFSVQTYIIFRLVTDHKIQTLSHEFRPSSIVVNKKKQKTSANSSTHKHFPLHTGHSDANLCCAYNSRVAKITLIIAYCCDTFLSFFFRDLDWFASGSSFIADTFYHAATSIALACNTQKQHIIYLKSNIRVGSTKYHLAERWIKCHTLFDYLMTH